MESEWGARLATILAILILIAGLLVLALAGATESPVVVQLGTVSSLRVADLIGAVMVMAGALLTWVTVLAWQRKHIQ